MMSPRKSCTTVRVGATIEGPSNRAGHTFDAEVPPPPLPMPEALSRLEPYMVRSAAEALLPGHCSRKQYVVLVRENQTSRPCDEHGSYNKRLEHHIKLRDLLRPQLVSRKERDEILHRAITSDRKVRISVSSCMVRG